ncbi:MAG: hypothetical protein ACR2MN_16275 [Acidimicrobiales bacterium]
MTLAYNPATFAWTIFDHETNQTLYFNSAGVLTADMDRNANPVTFSTDNANSGSNRQGGPTVLITGSAGLSPANSILADPSRSYYFDPYNNIHYILKSIAQVPGDGSGNRTTTFAYNTNNQSTMLLVTT